MRLRFLVVSLMVLALSAGTGFAQTFTGTVDGYWLYNSITPHNAGGSCRTNSSACNQYRAFDINDQAFSLNYGELAVEYKPNEVGIRVDFGFGDAAEVVNNNFSDGEFLRHIQQAYLTGTRGKFTVDFGKFVTPHGAEVIETKDNWNYSRGLLFTWVIPFYHFGGRATYVINDKATIGGYVVNGWNNVKDNNTAKSLGFTGSFKPHSKIGLVTNVLWGKEVTGSDESRTMLDGVLTYTHNDKLSFMANYDYMQDRTPPVTVGGSTDRIFVQGFAGYVKAKPVEKLTMSARYEWLGDHNGAATGTAQDLQSYTGTVSVPWSDLTLWGEFRRDTSDVASFTKWREGVFAPTSSQVKGQNTVTLGVTYAFTKMVK
jgi:hypothetical protein